jgi:hypothetical protein
MPTQYWIQELMKLSFLMAAVMNIPPVLLQRICMPSVILKEDNTILWKALLTTKLMAMPLSLLICKSSMAATIK